MLPVWATTLQPAEAARAEEVWQSFQARLAASATRGELRLVEGGTGYLPDEHSAAVVRAVEDVIQSAGE